jgi:hypothetical protein
MIVFVTSATSQSIPIRRELFIVETSLEVLITYIIPSWPTWSRPHNYNNYFDRIIILCNRWPGNRELSAQVNFNHSNYTGCSSYS